MSSSDSGNSVRLGQPARVPLRAEVPPGDEISTVHVLGRLDVFDQELCEALRDALT
jgi:hypothetical protein